MAGRPTDLTPEMHKALVGYIRKGVTYAIACDAAGIHYSTFKDWVSWGREGRAPFAAFAADVAQARAQTEVVMVQCLTDAARDDWKAAEAYLRRRYPSRWEPKQRSEVKVELPRMSQAELDVAIDAEMKARKAREQT